MLTISDFMKIINFSYTFIKWLIIKIFWCNKYQTRGLKVFWIDLQNQYLSKQKSPVRQENMSGSHKTLSPTLKGLFLIIKTTILFLMKQTHTCRQYSKSADFALKFNNLWNPEEKSSDESNCKFSSYLSHTPTEPQWVERIAEINIECQIHFCHLWHIKLQIEFPTRWQKVAGHKR